MTEPNDSHPAVSPVQVRRFSPKTVLLQGEPGTGKSRMAGLTAINKPVHFLDIDRKTASAAWATSAIAERRITLWELAEPIDDSNLKSRIKGLANMKGKVEKEPKGWSAFAEYVYEMPKTEEFKRAGTIVVDSLTLLNEHLKASIMYAAERSKFAFDQWNALKIGWMDTLSVLRDVAKEHGKDLILTVHERVGEIPGPRSLGVTYKNVPSGDGGNSRQREILGTLDLRIWASLDGQAGSLIGAEMDEYYHLYTEVDDDTLKVSWKCRVHPDGRRNLRTSFILDKDVYAPNFNEIWKI